MTDQRPYLMTIRCADFDDPVKGATRERCAECKSEVWVSPATMLLVREHDPMILCQACLSVELKGEFNVQPWTDAQRKELT